MDKKKLDIRMVYPGAKILALIISQELIPIDEIRKSAELLLSACAGNINIPLSRDKSLVDSFSLFISWPQWPFARGFGLTGRIV
uniref:Uncharacterized protein n=1 Tax=Ditylenchus dipsaci TaxID=166011 RepID=A0A915E2C9_9BILA